MEKSKKEYLQPVIDIEYYEDVILCLNVGTEDSPYGDDIFDIQDDAT